MSEQHQEHRVRLSSARRVVIKVGSQVLTTEDGRPNEALIGRLALEIAELRNADKDVIMVSSGAIAYGKEALDWEGEVRTVAESQMLASMGQPVLIQAHREALHKQGIRLAQVLLTHRDIADRTAYLNAHNTLTHLLQRGVVPVINENDAVGYEEICFGDNDKLAALVAVMVEADLVLLLTVPDGLYDQDPTLNTEAERIGFITPDAELPSSEQLQGTNDLGRGGMASKVDAAQIANEAGIAVVVSTGRAERPVGRVLDGADVGTLFPASCGPLEKRRHWVRHGLKVQGSILLDAGATRAVADKGASILPVGVVGVEGDFQRGEAVQLVGPEGRVLGRGLATYAANEIRKIKGKKSTEIKELLGYRYLDVVIHRDDLILGENGQP